MTATGQLGPNQKTKSSWIWLILDQDTGNTNQGRKNDKKKKSWKKATVN